MKKNEKIFLTFMVFVAIFLTLFRIRETQLIIHDTARDTLKILSIWQEKSFTLIGPIASFSLHSIQEFYFGSFSYYFGLLGMLVFGFQPVNAIVPTTILFWVSIPTMYIFLKNLNSSRLVLHLGTIFYVLSPLTITHMRFYWNPNTIIPLSVFFWYLVTRKEKTKIFEWGLIAGLISATVFNFHYFAVIPMAVWGVVMVFRKSWDQVMGILIGFLVGTIPLFLFELKHEFYLTKALIYNMNHRPEGKLLDAYTYLGRLGESFLAVLGIKSGEISYNTLLHVSRTYYWLVLGLLLFLTIYTIFKLKTSKKVALIVPLFVAIVFAAKFSDTEFYVRYVFGAFPLLIWFLAEMFDNKYLRYLVIPLLVLMIFSNNSILRFEPKLKTGYVSLNVLEDVSKKIVSDNPHGKYNLSENIYGDAQARGLRFFVQRDAAVKPQGDKDYGWLNRLYVLAPSLEKIKSDNRWEYYASGEWKNMETTNFGEVNLYRFDK